MLATTRAAVAEAEEHHCRRPDPDVRRRRRAAEPDREDGEETHVRRAEVSLDQRRGGEPADHEPDPRPCPQEAEAEVARRERLAREEHLGDVDDPARGHHDRPDHEDAQQRPGVADDRVALREVAPPPPPDRPVALKEPRGDQGDERGRDAECDRVHEIGEIRPRGCDDHSAEKRPECGRRPFDELKEGVRGPELPGRDKIRDPCEHRRAEEGISDPRQCGEHHDLRRRAGEREEEEHCQPPDVGGDHQPFPREPVDDGAEQEPDEDRRKNVRDQELPDPPGGVGPIVDVDLEGDDRQPVADPGRRGREEEQAEPAVPEEREASAELQAGHG